MHAKKRAAIDKKCKGAGGGSWILILVQGRRRQGSGSKISYWILIAETRL
jgi:hypothetical protein